MRESVYTKDIDVNVGQRIKALRKQSGLSQVNFCKALNMSPESRQTIAKWESGKTLPPIYSMVEICNFFGCDMGYLFGDYDCHTYSEQRIRDGEGLRKELYDKLTENYKRGLQLLEVGNE